MCFLFVLLSLVALILLKTIAILPSRAFHEAKEMLGLLHIFLLVFN